MTLARVREHARQGPEQEFLLNRLYGFHVSPYLTLLCLWARLTPDQVTILGATLGLLAAALLFLPLGWWSLLAALCLQLAYLLDFSDGQVARMTGKSSVAGAYLDWLSHFYIPVAAYLAAAASLTWETGWMGWSALGILAAIELAAFPFACKEHILVAMQRQRPALGDTAAFHAALADDARPADVATVSGGVEVEPSDLVRGRRHGRSLRSVMGEVLIYPGAIHLMTIAVVVDAALSAAGLPFLARGVVIALVAAGLLVHAPMAIRRNYRVIKAVESGGAVDEA